jgi:hypothetical protein
MYGYEALMALFIIFAFGHNDPLAISGLKESIFETSTNAAVSWEEPSSPNDYFFW